MNFAAPAPILWVDKSVDLSWATVCMSPISRRCECKGWDGASCHDARFQLSRGGKLKDGKVELEVLEVGFNQRHDGLFMGHWPRGVGEVKKDYVEVPFLHLCLLDRYSHFLYSMQPASQLTHRPVCMSVCLRALTYLLCIMLTSSYSLSSSCLTSCRQWKQKSMTSRRHISRTARTWNKPRMSSPGTSN